MIYETYYSPLRAPRILDLPVVDIAVLFHFSAETHQKNLLWDYYDGASLCLIVYIHTCIHTYLVYKDNYGRLNMIDRERANRALMVVTANETQRGDIYISTEQIHIYN